MKKLDNFSNCLEVLKSADFEMADNNDIYRTGVIGQFNLTFELAYENGKLSFKVYKSREKTIEKLEDQLDLLEDA